MPSDDGNPFKGEKTELEDSRQRFNAIVETVPDGILILDAKDKVLYGNPSAAALLSRSVSSLMNSELTFPMPGEGDSSEIDMARPGKGPGHVWLRIQKTNWCGQEVRLVLLTDITERKETEAELESARKTQLRMKDEFLSRVSHELRSPLNAVYQYVTLLHDGLAGGINDEQREYLGITLKNVKQLTAMIGDLLDVSRSKSGKLAVISREMSLLKNIEAAMDTVRPDAQAKNLSLSMQIAEGIPSAYADPQRVQQVIVNLVENAIKFTPEGGTIRVGARVYEPLPEKTEAEGAPSLVMGPVPWLEISVTDSGCGIAAEDHERIFQQLYQVDKHIDQKRMGLGLGLYICRDLVSRFGGRIWVDSCVGEGSTFFFTLPAYSAEHALLSLLHNRFIRAKARGKTFSVVVVDAAETAATMKPVWEALLVAAREKAFVAAYAGTRFVAVTDTSDAQAECIRERLRRLAKEECFQVAPALCLALSYGVAVSHEDSDSVDALLTRAGASEMSEQSLLAQKRLLVVDDDEMCLRLTHRFMVAVGVQSVRTATSGAKLFAALEEELADLIVVDIQMPGMNGHEIIGRLKENAETAMIPIVVVSGYVSERESIEGKTPGSVIPVLSKLNMKEVQNWVRHLL